MCQNATKTAASLMQAIEPTLKSFLSYFKLATTPAATAALNAYDAAVTALQNWQSGTAAQEVLQLIGDFQTVFNTLPIPPEAQVLANIIIAGVETVIGVVTANSPAPAAPVASATPAGAEETQAMHQAHVIADTTAKVKVLAPGFQRSIWHSPASQYKATWNKTVEANNFPAELKAA